MATTNFVRLWKDGDRLFVDVNGATIEAESLRFDAPLVTLQFQGNVVPLPGRRGHVRPVTSRETTAQGGGSTVTDADYLHNDPLLDECLW
jgi:hypothetical protein